jgi:hypothetical protein
MKGSASEFSEQSVSTHEHYYLQRATKALDLGDEPTIDMAINALHEKIKTKVDARANNEKSFYTLLNVYKELIQTVLIQPIGNINNVALEKEISDLKTGIGVCHQFLDADKKAKHGWRGFIPGVIRKILFTQQEASRIQFEKAANQTIKTFCNKEPESLSELKTLLMGLAEKRSQLQDSLNAVLNVERHTQKKKTLENDILSGVWAPQKLLDGEKRNEAYLNDLESDDEGVRQRV